MDNAGTAPKCIFTHDHFDWETDSPPKHSASDTVIYETHVRGLTIHPSSGVAHPGTFAGLTEKIPYLQNLGITAIELMPVLEFNENESERLNPVTGERLRTTGATIPSPFSLRSSRTALEDRTVSRSMVSRSRSSAKWSRLFTTQALR